MTIRRHLRVFTCQYSGNLGLEIDKTLIYCKVFSYSVWILSLWALYIINFLHHMTNKRLNVDYVAINVNFHIGTMSIVLRWQIFEPLAYLANNYLSWIYKPIHIYSITLKIVWIPEYISTRLTTKICVLSLNMSCPCWFPKLSDCGRGIRCAPWQM